MTRAALVLATAMATIGAASAALARDPPFVGNWARGDGKTRIRVWQCGRAICAVNTWVKPGATSEEVGDRLVFNIEPAGDAHWSGSAFDPKRRERYSVKVNVNSRNMTTAGCVMGGFICQSMTWTRLGHSK